MATKAETTDELSEIKARVGVLEKILDRVFDAIAVARTAEKTADKALAMSQEALVIITSGSNQPEVQHDPLMSDAEPVSSMFPAYGLTRTPSKSNYKDDDQAESEMEQAVNGEDEVMI